MPVHNAESTRDPSRTLTTRTRYVEGFNRRWRQVRGLVRTGIEERDALGVGESRFNQEDLPSPSFRGDKGQRAEEFREWLATIITLVVLGATRPDPDTFGRTPWFELFVRSAFATGLRVAAMRLKRVGIDPHPIITAGDPDNTLLGNRRMRSELESQVIRHRNEIRGVRDATVQQASREVIDGLATGAAPREMANRVNGRIEAIGEDRARKTARTETVGTAAAAVLLAYKMSGVEEVEAQLEFTTAGDERVCPICRALEGERYTIEQAQGVIPVHTNCRCSWTPVE